MGRLVREILRVTDPRQTFYAEQRNTWYDVRSKQPVVDILLFRKLHRAVGSFGLSGLDRLLSFMIVKELQLLTGTIQGVFTHKESSDMLDSFMRQLTPLDDIVGKYADSHWRWMSPSLLTFQPSPTASMPIPSPKVPMLGQHWVVISWKWDKYNCYVNRSLTN